LTSALLGAILNIASVDVAAPFQPKRWPAEVRLQSDEREASPKKVRFAEEEMFNDESLVREPREVERVL
jgi:hypothetical protein